MAKIQIPLVVLILLLRCYVAINSAINEIFAVSYCKITTSRYRLSQLAFKALIRI